MYLSPVNVLINNVNLKSKGKTRKYGMKNYGEISVFFFFSVSENYLNYLDMYLVVEKEWETYGNYKKEEFNRCRPQ